MSKEAELLGRVIATKGFLRSVLVEDNLREWELAKELGEYLVRTVPQVLLGHVVLARACRHLGDLQRAKQEVERCRAAIAEGTITAVEEEMLVPLLEVEERILYPSR